MAEASGESFLDELFESLEWGRPQGYKCEVVEGSVLIWPQQKTQWQIGRNIVDQLCTKYPSQKSDVRIDYPGHLNGFASAVTLVADGAETTPGGLWRYQDVEFVAEVISKETAHNNYGTKKTAYAVAEVPIYLIADPYQGKCHLYTQPKGGDDLSRLSVAFGVDLAIPHLGLTLKTEEFPRA